MNRDRYISQLRKLADLLEANESLPLPGNGNLLPAQNELYAYVSRGRYVEDAWDDDIVNVVYDTPVPSSGDLSTIVAQGKHLAAAIEKVLGPGARDADVSKAIAKVLKP